MSDHFHHILSMFGALILCAYSASAFAADPPRADISANVAGVMTGFADIEANFWATRHLAVGLALGSYKKGLLHAWDTHDFSGHAVGGQLNWVFGRDCRALCWTVSARYLRVKRLQESDLSLPAGTFVHYAAANDFVGFGGTFIRDRFVLKFSAGPDYWNNPKDIPAQQSSNASKTVEAIDHGLGIDAELLVGVTF